MSQDLILVCGLAFGERRDVRGGHPQPEREPNPLAAGTAVTANDHVAIESELVRCYQARTAASNRRLMPA
jgi:hypothetical protein